MERSKSDERQHFPISRCILLLSSIFAVRSFIASMLCLLLRSIVSSIAPFSSSFATLWTIVAVGVADAVSFVRLFFPQIYIFSIFYRFPLSAHICVRQQHSIWRYTLPSTFSFFLQVQGIFVASQCRTDFTVTIPSNINVNIFTFWFRFCFVRRRKTINKYPLFRKKQHISMHQ